MSEIEARPSNFARQIIDEGLASDEYTATHTCFPSEPNGYLYIGHTKSTYLNFSTAQDYQGQCNLCFDDTDLVKENIEYAESIKNDVERLGFHWTGNTRYSPGYFDQPHVHAIELINKGLAHVDGLSADEIREYRGVLTQSGKNSPYHDRSAEKGPALLEKTRTDDLEGDKAYLRVKVDAASPFITVCDPMLYRIKSAEHHQAGNKWCICPVYDFIHCTSDALEGITHSLRTLKFQDNHRLYDWVLDNTVISVYPRRYEFSCLNLEYTVMSKRKLNPLATDKHVEGWNDPRMPTVSGLRRRGYTVTATHEFYKRIDVIKQDNTTGIVSLESCIREDLNENTSRAIATIDPTRLVIENYPQGESELVTMPNHPNKPEMGSREAPFSGEIRIDCMNFHEEANKQYRRLVVGKEARLYNTYVIKARRTEKNAEGNTTTILCTYDADTLSRNPTDSHKARGVIYWVNAFHALSIEIRLHDRLFNVPNPGAAEDSLSAISLESLVTKQDYSGSSLKVAVVDKAFWFEREGYFCLGGYHATADKPVFNRIAGLRDTWARAGEQAVTHPL